MFTLENIQVPCYLRNIVGNFDSRSLPNSGDFDNKILKMSEFPWVACPPPPPLGENIDRCIIAGNCKYCKNAQYRDQETTHGCKS
jgi:hypothetical protein